ncbi:hypothetical protein J4230_02470 [Candidatus Woesearchaeota archaeon]|nr:hypothetical protein [Candidatus Woesearchaeota archaeon]
MLIQELSGHEKYIYTERYINQFKKVANEVSPEYCAINGLPCFLLPNVILDINKVKLFLANPRKDIFDKVVFDSNIKFFFHPQMIDEFNFSNVKCDTIVEPTSSTRTVVPKNENFAIKLHLNKRLSKYIRRLKADSVEHSVLVSSELEKGSKDINCPGSFGFLPESIGIAYNDIGMIIREMLPRPLVDENRILVPLFSFYSRDMDNDSHMPFFVQLVNTGNYEPLDFFIEKIIRPLFANMSYFINEYGLLLEPHGQNVLVEMDSGFNTTRLIHRDFQSIYIDREIRNNKNLDTKFRKHIMGEECPKEVSYSLVYDQFVGEYLIENFVNLIFNTWNIPRDIIIYNIKEVFKEYFDLSLFPKDCYYMMSKSTFNDNTTTFDRYHIKPKYRP